MEYNNIYETEGHDWRIMWASGHFKTNVFENLMFYQKINHFPGSTELTYKNRMAVNLRKQREKYGDEYDIFPETYVLPDDYAEAYSSVEKGKGGLWISKPYSQSQGRGIYIVSIIKHILI